MRKVFTWSKRDSVFRFLSRSLCIKQENHRVCNFHCQRNNDILRWKNKIHAITPAYFSCEIKSTSKKHCLKPLSQHLGDKRNGIEIYIKSTLPLKSLNIYQTLVNVCFWPKNVKTNNYFRSIVGPVVKRKVCQKSLCTDTQFINYNDLLFF